MEYAQKGLDLTEGSIWRKIVIFALPILVGSLLQQLYTTVDAIIIGQVAGKNALAAIDAVYNLIKLPVNFFTGVSSGATIIISQYYGAKERERVSNASHTALLFAFSGGLLLSILGILFAPFCLELLQVPDDIYQDALSYVRIYFGGMAASMTYNIGAGTFLFFDCRKHYKRCIGCPVYCCFSLGGCWGRADNRTISNLERLFGHYGFSEDRPALQNSSN